ncbi:MAG: hypothetical protein AUK47_23285 [Deltaproteobacteria bacterium CG2_30_63_29]|nr:MAG: hypothetical protein AUK47_23285 [Deltaproteobacteria bacterium CG2_30_63_29]
MESCAQCHQPFEAAKLNLTERGNICDLCMAEVDELDVSKGALAKVRSILIAAAVSAAAGTFISFRSSSSSSSSFGGHGTSTASISADLPGLIGSGLALLCVLFGLFTLFTTKPIDDASRKSMLKQKLVMGLLFLVVGGWALLHFLASMPSSTSSSF